MLLGYCMVCILHATLSCTIPRQKDSFQISYDSSKISFHPYLIKHYRAQNYQRWNLQYVAHNTYAIRHLLHASYKYHVFGEYRYKLSYTHVCDART